MAILTKTTRIGHRWQCIGTWHPGTGCRDFIPLRFGFQESLEGDLAAALSGGRDTASPAQA